MIPFFRNFIMSKASAVKIVPQKHIDEGTSFASTLKALEDPIPSLPAKPITISIVGAGQRFVNFTSQESFQTKTNDNYRILFLILSEVADTHFMLK